FKSQPSELAQMATKGNIGEVVTTCESFGNTNTFVNLTTDVWSAPHGVPGSYIFVTAHWIEPGERKPRKDKIGSKPDKKGKRVEAGKSLKHLQ
nr:zinc finger BED domain-containing protein RICESLEEPER 2-like [Tanacetum cinerariifolium]